MKSTFILLVEDNPDDEVLTVRALKRNHVINEVVIVRDGVEVLDFLFCRGAYASRDPEEMPELILLDLRLPKVDGIEVLRQIRTDQRTQWLPVIIFTSSKRDQDMVDSLHYGANAYIRKPVDMQQFIEAIRELHLYLVVLNEKPLY
jgi:two-component system, response regulator